MIETPNTRTSLTHPAVLLVDDDSFMLELISGMLRNIGITRIVTATDGAQALKAFESGRSAPELIICDLNMPNQDGFQFMESLAEKRFQCNVILISGLAPRFIHSAELMGKLHNLNVIGTLQKPFDKAALSALIAKLPPTA